jgi:hypothetical protein
MKTIFGHGDFKSMKDDLISCIHLPLRTVRPIYRTGVPQTTKCYIIYIYIYIKKKKKYKY